MEKIPHSTDQEIASKFLGAFMVQTAWVSLCPMPVVAVNSIPHTLLSTLQAIGIFDIIGLTLYVRELVV
jgi:hypothetical protein